jgi:hypothetical protein
MSDTDLELLAEWRRVIERQVRGDYLTVEELCEILRRDYERRERDGDTARVRTTVLGQAPSRTYRLP